MIIQLLIVNMISTIPDNRESDDLPRAVELFQQHIQNKHHKTFTNKASSRNAGHRKKKRQSASATSDTAASVEYRNNSPISARIGFLFGLLLLIFVQYLHLFDEQEKINQSLPEVYSMLVDRIEGFRTD